MGSRVVVKKFGEDAGSGKSQTPLAEVVQRAQAYDARACYARAGARRGKAERGSARPWGPGFTQQNIS